MKALVILTTIGVTGSIAIDVAQAAQGLPNLEGQGALLILIVGAIMMIWKKNRS